MVSDVRNQECAGPLKWFGLIERSWMLKLRGSSAFPTCKYVTFALERNANDSVVVVIRNQHESFGPLPYSYWPPKTSHVRFFAFVDQCGVVLDVLDQNLVPASIYDHADRDPVQRLPGG